MACTHSVWTQLIWMTRIEDSNMGVIEQLVDPWDEDSLSRLLVDIGESEEPVEEPAQELAEEAAGDALGDLAAESMGERVQKVIEQERLRGPFTKGAAHMS